MNEGTIFSERTKTTNTARTLVSEQITERTDSTVDLREAIAEKRRALRDFQSYL